MATDLSPPEGSGCAQGCIFGAVILFVLLLIGLLTLAFFRFSQRPHSSAPQPGEISYRPSAPPLSVAGKVLNVSFRGGPHG
jgi:hypothetical protein